MSGKSIEELDGEMLANEQQVMSPKQINSPEDVYAQFFYLYSIQYKNLINNLSVKALRRLLKALVEYPLNEKDYQHTTQEEKNALLIAMRLLEAKQMMILHAMTQHATEEQKNEAEENKQGDANGEEKNSDRVSS